MLQNLARLVLLQSTEDKDVVLPLLLRDEPHAATRGTPRQVKPPIGLTTRPQLHEMLQGTPRVRHAQHRGMGDGNALAWHVAQTACELLERPAQVRYRILVGVSRRDRTQVEISAEKALERGVRVDPAFEVRRSSVAANESPDGS